MRRPVRSNVIRRRMFNGGMGMTTPGAPMASGILASSQPLIDVLANQARDNLTNGINVGSQMYGSNVQGTNLMNQGGVANYAPGGISYTTNEAGDVVRIPISGSQEEAEIVENEGLGMFAGMTEDQFKRSDAPGSFIGRKLRQGEASVEFAWQQHIAKGGDGSAPLVLEDGTIIIGNPDGSGGQLYAKGPDSGQDIYETPLVTGLTKENIGMRDFPDVNIRGLAGDPDVVEKLDSEGQPIVEAEIIQQEKLPVEETIEQMKRIQSSKKDLADMIESGSTDTNVNVEKTFGLKEGDPYNFKNKDIYAAFGADAIDETKEKVIVKEKDKKESKSDAEEIITKETTTEETTPDDPYDFTDKDIYAAFGAESVATVRKEATNGNEKEVAKTMEDYRKEFTKNMPAYKGMTDEEKGNAWIKMGMAIAGGESPNAIVNISKGVLATIDEFADDPKQKREYETSVGLAASKYAIESVASDRATEKTLETNFEDYVVTEAGTITYPNGRTVDVSAGQVVTVSAKDKLDGMDMSNLITTGMYGQDMDNIRALKAISVSTEAAMRDELVVKGKESEAVTKRYVLNMDKVISGQELKALVANSMEMNATTGVTGFSATARNAALKAFSAAGVSPQIIGMSEKEAVEFLGSQQLYNDQMQIVANSMLKTLLGEGSKNISNVDRELAQEISGLIKGLQAGLFQNETLLQNKLQRIYTLIDRNQEAALGQVQSIAREYDNRLVAGTNDSYYQTILKPIFAEKETQLQTSRIPGSGVLGVGELGTFKTDEKGIITYTMNKSEPKS